MERGPETGIDFGHANAARVYDYFLGGGHNFAVDRALAARIAAVYPDVQLWARANRALLMRMVRYCVDHGIRQFLDLGSGIPTIDSVHATARAIAPDTRVAYVDFEPVAVAHSQDLLAGTAGVSVTRADLRHPAAVVGTETVTDVLDFREPVAVLAVAVLHFLADADDPAAVVAGYRQALAPGSYLAITHTSADLDDPAMAARLAQGVALYRHSATPAYPRDRATIAGILGDLSLVEPGLVDLSRWRSDDPRAPELGAYAALARIP